MTINVTPQTTTFDFDNENEKSWLFSMLEIAKSALSDKNALDSIEKTETIESAMKKVLNGTLFVQENNSLTANSKELLPILMIVETVLEIIPNDTEMEKARSESLRVLNNIIIELKTELGKK